MFLDDDESSDSPSARNPFNGGASGRDDDDSDDSSDDESDGEDDRHAYQAMGGLRSMYGIRRIREEGTETAEGADESGRGRGKRPLPSGVSEEEWTAVERQLKVERETPTGAVDYMPLLDSLPQGMPQTLLALPISPASDFVDPVGLRLTVPSPSVVLPGTISMLTTADTRLLYEIARRKTQFPHFCVGLFLPDDPAPVPRGEVAEAAAGESYVRTARWKLPHTLPVAAARRGRPRREAAPPLPCLQDVGVVAHVISVTLPEWDPVWGSLRKGSGEIVFVVLPQRVRITGRAAGASPGDIGGMYATVEPLELSRRGKWRKAADGGDDEWRRDALLMCRHALQEPSWRGDYIDRRMRSFALPAACALDLDVPGEAADLALGAVVTQAIDAPAAYHAQAAALREVSVDERLATTVRLLRHERLMARMVLGTWEDVEKMGPMDNVQGVVRELRKRLGEDVPPASPAEEYRARLEGKTLSPAAMETVTDELRRLETLPSASAEYGVCRNYLDVLTSLPWGVFAPETYDLDRAEKVLADEHFGLQDVKDRVLELTAVGKLRNSMQGKIILLVGAPGVGKTSMAQSIAHALDRPMFRFSVGGMTDEAEIRGSRRTYVGAMPGKPLQALRVLGVANPVLLIDEVDKIVGSTMRGNPSAALLEVLDPAQNSAFVDHYADVPFDLSRVLFVCTANTTSGIPQPLLDRMEIIRIAGYTQNEKLAIANEHLVPAVAADSGLENRVTISQDALSLLVERYCREAGVRDLKRSLERIYRKIALRIAEEAVEGVVPVEESDLEKLLGKPPYPSESLYEETPAGVVMGLAWSDRGGSTPFVEVVADEAARAQRAKKKKGHSGSLRVTGQLGDIMSESTEIAHTVARNYARAHAPIRAAAAFLDDAVLHMHMPAGSVPKDGPSSGVAMVTALLSLALSRPVRPKLAFTGEVTVTGRILPVGGIKEKVLAARRANVREIVLPSENERDWFELDSDLTSNLQPHFVSNYDQVYKLLWTEQ